jgi:hypothetical protein
MSTYLICTHTHMCVYMYVYVCMYICVCMYVYMHMYIQIMHTYIHKTYIHTCIHRTNRSSIHSLSRFKPSSHRAAREPFPFLFFPPKAFMYAGCATVLPTWGPTESSVWKSWRFEYLAIKSRSRVGNSHGHDRA